MLNSMKKKLAISVSSILVLGVSLVLAVSNSFIRTEALADVDSSNRKLASSLGQFVKSQIEMSNARGRSWIVSAPTNEGVKKQLEGDASILGIEVIELATRSKVLSAFQSRLGAKFAVPALSSKPLEVFEKADKKDSSNAVIYEVVQMNSQPVHRFSTPLVTDDKEGKVLKIMSIYLDPEIFKSTFSASEIEELFLFDTAGTVLVRSPPLSDGYFEGLKMPDSAMGILHSVVNEQVTFKQLKVLKNDSKESFFVGVHDSHTGVFVAVTTSEAKILEKINSITKRSLYLGLALLMIALWFAMLFADSIVQPILRLVDATKRLSQGDFTVRLRPTTKDELSVLTRAFNGMAEGLAERERIKEVFGKFHSKGVIQKMLKEERINLGGDRIPTTVFFSDIRSFTTASEHMQPEHVVEMLNEYMGEMVAVIDRFGGDVDKYVGDAIMAIWGISLGDPATEAERAVLACLEMREKLKDLNFRRNERGQPAIKIGMGLNSGVVVFGKIGSPNRMEYTVIGDTVNTASRMESLTKEFQTDLLVNESTVKLLPRPEIFEFVGPFETKAKGKVEAVFVYGCKGLKPEFAHLLLETAAALNHTGGHPGPSTT